ncbi:MAG: DUF502 domain-containing protein [Bacteroidia bacterium]
MKKILSYFIQGLIVVVPGVITGLVLYQIASWFWSLFQKLDTVVHPYVDPLIIIGAVIAFIILLGMFASSFFAKLFMDEFEKVLERIPVIRHIYSPVKDFTSAFIGNKKKFSNPVLVTTNLSSNIREIGFITDDDLTEFGIGKEYVAVYMPMSYAISGRVLIVPREQVQILNTDAADTMKFIVSGGISQVD